MVHCLFVDVVWDEYLVGVMAGVLLKEFSVVKAAEGHSLEEQHEHDSAGDSLVGEEEVVHLDLVQKALFAFVRP